MKLSIKKSYLVASVGLHILLVGLLSVSFTATSPKQATPMPQGEPIQAVTISQKAVDEQVKRLQAEKDKARRAEQERIAALERKLKQAEEKRQAEEERIKSLELQRKKKLEETEKAEEAARKAKLKQKEEAEKAKQAETLRKQKEAERVKAEKAAADAKRKREKEEAERKRKAEEAKERAELEELMQQELEAESERMGAQRQAQVLSELDKYKALIVQKIRRNWLTDIRMSGKKCDLIIRLASDGLVISVDNGVGDPLVCDSARKAVLKANTLPVSVDPDVNQQMREIKLTMEPDL